MKTELSSLELHYLIKELQVLISAKVEQVYQIAGEEVIIQFHIPNQGKQFLRIIMGDLLYLASNKGAVPEKPPNFCLYLRRKLKNSRLRSISQEGFERVINLLFETKDAKFNVHVELFSKGNIIIADENDIILSAFEYQEWGSRSIKPKKTYIPPSKGCNFLTLSQEELKSIILNSEKENLVKSLAIDLGLGGLFSEELCTLADLDKSVKANSLTDAELDALYTQMQSLKSKEILPAVHTLSTNSETKEVLPFPVNLKNSIKSTSFESFNKALDSVFTKHLDSSKVESVQKDAKTKLNKVNDIIEQQTLRIKGLEVSEQENQKKGELIYENYVKIDDLLKHVAELRKEHSWKEVEEILKSESLIKSINEKTGEINLVL